MEDKIKKGSEWGKWDLHIHTPASFHWEQGKKFIDMDSDEKIESIKEFIKSVNESDISVFCIQDYWTFEGYLELIKYCNNNPGELKKTIFPGMELRIEAPGDYRLNIHVILSNELTNQQLSDFKSELMIRNTNRKISNEALIEFGKSLDAGKAKKHGFDNPINLDNDKLLELGSQTAEITKSSLENALKQIPEGTGFIMLPFDTSDGLSKLKLDTQPGATNYFMQHAHIIESRNKETKDLFNCIKTDLNKSFFDNFYKSIDCKAKPCVCGSDAHKFTKYGIFPSNKITWIKSNPTFEGLKQIIYEPIERVEIQENSPEFEYNKPYFDSINIKNDIKLFNDSSLKLNKNELKLNKNMVAVIGGRGEGKSTLIEYLFNSFNKYDKKPYSNDENFEIVYNKINALEIDESDISTYISSQQNINELDFVFIKQGELKDKTGNELSSNLKAMLNITEAYFSREISESITKINEEIESIEKWKLVSDFDDNKINCEEFHNSIIDKNKKLLDNLKNSKNKGQIEKYNLNLKEISKFKNQLTILNIGLEKINYFEIDFNELVSDNNELFEKIDLKEHKDKINKKITDISKKGSEIDKFNETIKKELLNEGISGDLTSLLENTAKYQFNIDESEKSILQIKSKEKKIFELKNQRGDLGINIKKEYEEQKIDIDKKWSEFLSKHTEEKQKIIKEILLKDDKIKISGKIIFNVEKFYNLLSDSVNKNTYSDLDNLKYQFKITNLESWCDYIKSSFNNKYSSLNHKKQEFLDLFFLTKKREKYLRVEAEITSDNTELSKLSVGQRGTAYLRIQLANSAFDKPLIFDQPEDDLDNKFIMDELVDIFKQLKKYRQIIIVTHNANLVVNADVEQVIIASNENQELSYKSGSLENTYIKNKICEILEGGDIAFNKRKMKYDI